MLAKPLSRVLLFALAGAVLAGAIALKQRASSRALLNAEPNASITRTLAREKLGCKGAMGYAADHPICLNGRAKTQERFTSAGDLASSGSADSVPPDRSAKRSSLAPEGTVESDARAGRASRLIPSRSSSDDTGAD